MDERLQNKHCLACEGGVKPMSLEEAKQLLQEVPHWELNEEGTSIHRRFNFKNFYHTMSFVNAVAWVANQENHHPDMEVGYNYCVLTYSTHAINSLSINDFICAAKVDGLGV